MNEFIMKRDEELNFEKLEHFIKLHKDERRPRYDYLKRMYESKHDILFQKKKETHKPDNRLVVNYAKTIVDSLNGFFIGVPIKLEHKDENVSAHLEFIDAYSNVDDENAEISKMCSIYGHCFELNYMDEEAIPCVIKLSPEQAFIIYDDGIRKRPLYGVRYYVNTDGEIEGSFSDSNTITYFTCTNGIYAFSEAEAHFFGEVPIDEFVENEEKQAAFESVDTLINAYNKAISEKANDVDYFADAYLAILGPELKDVVIGEDEEGNDVTVSAFKAIRDSRVINLYDVPENGQIEVKFLDKPNADQTQENLIDRLELLIYQISMVVDTSDENLGGNTSGISLKYKLQSMYNLAKTKERKFAAALNRRYRRIGNVPTSQMKKDDWIKIKYHFTRNLPNNLLEESEVARNLEGVVSKETQLKLLSVVDDVQAEIQLIQKDKKDETQRSNRDGYGTLEVSSIAEGKRTMVVKDD